MIGTPDERDDVRRELDSLGLATDDESIDLVLILAGEQGPA